jgi:hypothetical protein
VLAFAGGVAVGHYLIPRRVPEGVVVTIKSTSRIPTELEELELTDAQRTEVRRILDTGTMRVGEVMRRMMAPMDSAIAATDREIRGVLDADQIRELDEIRKARPLRRIREKRVIDTAR